jgi:integrase
MKSRRAALNVSHQKACPQSGRAGLDSLDGCNCKPSYFTVYRDSSGRLVRGDDGTGTIVGRTRRRRDAERWLDRLTDRLEQGAADPERRKEITFPAWVDEYKTDLQKKIDRGGMKARTLRGYSETLTRAVDEIGHCDLRAIGKTELDRFIDSYGEQASDATLSRGLRELSACLTAAIDEGYLERNPVRVFTKKRGLERKGTGKDAFTDDELPKLWAVLEHGIPTETKSGIYLKGNADPVYLHLCRVAATTGARLGELIALDWDQVSLTEKTVKILYTYNVEDGLTAPKTKGSVRTIYLTPAALAEFETMAARKSTGAVFAGPRSERLNAAYVARVLGRAMTASKIPRLGENGKPRSFHSFRSTYDRRMLEQGMNPEWVRRNLGHASLELTLNHYGTWQSDAMQAEAAKATDEL